VGRRRGRDQTFQADFNELLFILIALKLVEILGNSHPDLLRPPRPQIEQATVPTHLSSGIVDQSAFQ
jgi:hypothetical protein